MSREVWRWSFARAATVAGLFLCVDLPFFAANMLKIRYGGWVPLVIAAAIFLLMTTWKRGREILAKRMLEKTVPLKMLLADLAAEPPIRDPGIEDVLGSCRAQSLDMRMEGATFFLGRETLVASERPGMAQWREQLFAFMSRNALRATAFFKIPANQVFEVGAQVEL